jgi:hypothetical protein
LWWTIVDTSGNDVSQPQVVTPIAFEEVPESLHEGFHLGAVRRERALVPPLTMLAGPGYDQDIENAELPVPAVSITRSGGCRSPVPFEGDRPGA